MYSKLKSSFRQLPLRWQLLIAAGLVGTGLIATVGSLLIAKDLAKIRPLVQEASSRQTELVAKLSIDALIVEDRPALQTMIDGLKGLGAGLIRLELSDVDGEPLAYWKSEQPEDKVIYSTQQITHAGQHFGTLTMEWSYAHFANPILRAKTHSILATFLALAALIVLLGIALQWYLIYPLQYLEWKVRSVTKDTGAAMRQPQMIARELRAIDESLDETATALAEKAEAEARVLQERSRAETAEAAARAKMDFLSLMSHEIRTPLGAMMGFGSLLESADLTAEERDNLKNLNHSGKFLLRVLNDLLDLSKIEANGVELELLPTSPRSLLSELETMVRPLANTAGISLEISCETPEKINIIADRHRLKQVLMNLVGNAIKFTETGGVIVRAVTPEEPVAPGATLQVRFEVEDTGIGMTPDQCVHIFEPFSQADPTTTRRFGGTGLGLSVAREYVRKMGAELNVVSELGAGSKFSFEASFPTTADEEPQAQGPDNRTLYQGSSDLRILVAEDEHVNRLLIGKIFASIGHVVEFADDGQICIDRLASGIDYDVIFLDLHMPHVGGMEIARTLRGGDFGEAGRTVKLAIMSADVLAEQELRDIGIDAFISKPIDQQKLENFLASIPLQKPRCCPLPRPRTRALIVEDHALNRNLLAQILNRLDVETYLAKDGMECLEFLAGETKIDLILLDLRMPRMNGFTVVDRIRNGQCGEAYTNVPIAIVSAEAFNTGAIDVLDISDHIPKPIDINRLGRFIDGVKDDHSLIALSG